MIHLLLAGLAAATNIDDDWLEQSTQRLVPTIERALQRQFVELPRARLGSQPAVLEEYLALAARVPPWLHAGPDGRQLALGGTGAYLPHANQAIVFGDEVVDRGQELGYTAARFDAAFSCALARELARALQRQSGATRSDGMGRAMANAQAHLATEAACGAGPAMELRYRDRARSAEPGEDGSFDLGLALPFLRDAIAPDDPGGWAVLANPPPAELVATWNTSRLPPGWNDPEMLLPALAELRPAGGDRDASEASVQDPFPDPGTKRAMRGRVCVPIHAAMSLGIRGKLRNARAVAILAASADEAACWIKARRRAHATEDAPRFIVGPIHLDKPETATPEMGRQLPLEWLHRGHYSYRIELAVVREAWWGEAPAGSVGELWLATGRQVLGVSYHGGELASGVMARALGALVGLHLSETPRPTEATVAERVASWRTSLPRASVASADYFALRLLPALLASPSARCSAQGERWLGRDDLGDATNLARAVAACLDIAAATEPGTPR